MRPGKRVRDQLQVETGHARRLFHANALRTKKSRQPEPERRGAAGLPQPSKLSHLRVVERQRIQEDQQLVTRQICLGQLREVDRVERRAGVIQFGHDFADQAIGRRHALSVGQGIGRSEIADHGDLGRAVPRLPDQFLRQGVEAGDLLHDCRIIKPAAVVAGPEIAEPQGGAFGSAVENSRRIAANDSARFFRRLCSSRE